MVVGIADHLLQIPHLAANIHTIAPGEHNVYEQKIIS
jgi:hypothetical protein